MSTIRGWLAKGFDPKSCGENYVHVPKSGTGKSLVHESHEIFGKSVYQDGISGRWHFDEHLSDRFEVREELGKLVAEWTLKDHYRRPDHGPMHPTVYGPDEGRSGTAKFEPNFGHDCNSSLSIDGCKSIEDLRDLYFAVRRGKARIVEVWDGRNRSPESAKIAELEQQIAGCQARIAQLDGELQQEKARVRLSAMDLEHTQHELEMERAQVRLSAMDLEHLRGRLEAGENNWKDAVEDARRHEQAREELYQAALAASNIVTGPWSLFRSRLEDAKMVLHPVLMKYAKR